MSTNPKHKVVLPAPVVPGTMYTVQVAKVILVILEYRVMG